MFASLRSSSTRYVKSDVSVSICLADSVACDVVQAQTRTHEELLRRLRASGQDQPTMSRASSKALQGKCPRQGT